ncbi:MAG: hypothetical protein JRF04_02025 [Deltaproteobacteria bacterium]|nr:hypothetical protein [Deltaproteobacteria bacterium]
MNTPAQYRRVLVEDIDLTDTRYSLNPFPHSRPDTQLSESIDTFGILHPPLLLELDTNNYIVLSGRKRIQISAEEVDSLITAIVISCRYINKPLVIFSTLLQHRLIGSPLGIIEQSIFFKKAMACLPTEEIIRFLPMMGYKEKLHIPRDIISLLELHPSAQLGLHKGVLSLRAGKKLLLFPSEDQRVLAELINELQLGGSKQQKLINLVLELTKRSRISTDELLYRWREKEKDKQHNGPQKVTSLLSWLQRKCSPRSVAEEDNFKKFSRQFELPAGVRISHTLSFEDERVTLSVEFSSRKILEKQWPQIRSLLINPDLGDVTK